MKILGFSDGEQKYFVRRNIGQMEEGDVLEPGTYFVLKFRDMFALSALEAYRDAVIEYAKTSPDMDKSIREDAVEYISELQKLIEKAKTTNVKYPD